VAVRHIQTGIVHSGQKGGKTGCGDDTREKPSHWEYFGKSDLPKEWMQVSFLK
tara:strand:+ start:497 stop:655 length:159 start_codon:yes stop_codon:yes gene_type:complete